MKKDRLERFIRDNREAFDAHEPAADGWARLEQRLGPETPHNGHVVAFQPETLPKWNNVFRRNPWVWRSAASLLLVLGVLGAWWVRTAPSPSSNPEAVMAQIDPQAAQATFRYASMIETKRQEIKRFAQTDPDLYREFSAEIEALDRDYQRLKAELPQTPNQEELLKAMIENLQTQVDILNRQLSIIQRVNQAKQRHEPTI